MSTDFDTYLRRAGDALTREISESLDVERMLAAIHREHAGDLALAEAVGGGITGIPLPRRCTTPTSEVEPLVQAAVDGDREAVAELLTRIRPLIVRYCRAQVAQGADDLAQEICLDVLRALPHYHDQGRPFLAFVYGIATHRVAQMPGLRRRIDDLLALLPPRHRDVVTLRVVLGLSAEETGRVLGMTPSAVRVAQHRALNRLRRHTGRSGGA